MPKDSGKSDEHSDFEWWDKTPRHRRAEAEICKLEEECPASGPAAITLSGSILNTSGKTSNNVTNQTCSL
jgi:hypothetical protein